ncbi:DUF3987 domain-containing protein [Rhodohalobacter sp. SW132]|uniref:DUF3987 domain-containing protein n=1 Tax=Rhodohalobacter sp. SW132 TaxID=2293433 RepID=UPI000E393FE1|nr:DUF3987 domain-containing protein [Rhodohalobacter sp. SW132]REL38692.1 DUF3987 domain-containing protein [Rhodohalobacter sp. SW132]
MSQKTLGTLPDPPRHLSDDARRIWLEVGIKLLRDDSLTEASLQKLEDLCYWEDQRLGIMEKLRGDQAAGIAKSGRSIHLKNLKAVKQEMDSIRLQLGMEAKETKLPEDTPSLPDEAYESLPSLVRSCCDRLGEAERKDMFLLAMLPFIAAHLPKTLAEHADGYYTLSVNCFLMDGSGFAKRASVKVKALSYGVLNLADKNSERALFTIEDELNRSEDGRRSQNETRTLLQTDMNTLLQNDSVFREAGPLNDLFEQIFQAVPVVQPGQGNLSSLIIAEPKEYTGLALKSGPGLFSSFLLYGNHQSEGWQSNRPDSSTRALSKDIARLSGELFEIKSRLKERDEPLTVELSDNQWQMIDDTFAEKMEIIEELGLSGELQVINQKAAIYTLKLAAIFAVLRVYEYDPVSVDGEYLTPSDDDVIAALWIADTCLKHAIRLYEIIPGKEDVDARGDRYLKYHNVLPATFETAEALELAEKMGIPERTAKRYLNGLLEEKKVARVRRGLYEKIS